MFCPAVPATASHILGDCAWPPSTWEATPCHRTPFPSHGEKLKSTGLLLEAWVPALFSELSRRAHHSCPCWHCAPHPEPDTGSTDSEAEGGGRGRGRDGEDNNLLSSQSQSAKLHGQVAQMASQGSFLHGPFGAGEKASALGCGTLRTPADGDDCHSSVGQGSLFTGRQQDPVESNEKRQRIWKAELESLDPAKPAAKYSWNS